MRVTSRILMLTIVVWASAIAQHNGVRACYPPNIIPMVGCRLVAQQQSRGPANVCGHHSVSCTGKEFGIIDKSVQVENFDVGSRCSIQQVYSFPTVSWFNAHVTNAEIIITGQEQNMSTQEINDFEARAKVSMAGYVYTISRNGCLRQIYSGVNSAPIQGLEVISGKLSEESKRLLLDSKQLPQALANKVKAAIDSAGSIVG